MCAVLCGTLPPPGGGLPASVKASSAVTHALRAPVQHLREIAPKYVATKFVSINAEKTPFFVTKLAVRYGCDDCIVHTSR